MSTASNESSVVVSLNELMRLEEQRQDAEAEGRRAREAAVRQAAAAVEARERAAEEERLRTAEARRRADALANREQEARLQAMKEAAIVRARHEAEAAARARELLATREHERALAAARDDARHRGVARAAYGTAAMLAATWVMGGWYSLQTAHQIAAERLACEQVSTTLQSTLGRLQRGFEAEGGQIAGLQRDFADLRRNQVAPASAQGEVVHGPRRAAVPVALPEHQMGPPRPPCKKGDPICSDLP